MDELTHLALAARDGDRRSLDRLVDACFEQVWRLAARLVDEQSADDLAQETLVRAVRALPNFRGDSSARTWLLAVARNTCVDELRCRSRQRRRDAALAAAATDHARLVVDPAREVAVADLLSRLTMARREAFVLTQMLGLSYKEAAEVCTCPIGTIRSRVARARADLLEFMASSGAVEATTDHDLERSEWPSAGDMTC